MNKYVNQMKQAVIEYQNSEIARCRPVSAEP